MRLLLRGTEEVTVETAGTMAARRARELVPPALALEEVEGRVPVSLLLFEMRGLRLGGVPPGFDYGEALWRVGVRHRDGRAWFAVACDLSHPFVALVGARLVRYPVRAARLAFLQTGEREVTARVESPLGRLVVQSAPGERSPAPEPPRPLLVAPEATALWRIPWAEEPAPVRHDAVVRIVDIGLSDVTFGTSVEWSGQGLLHRGRVHRCGFALPAEAV